MVKSTLKQSNKRQAKEKRVKSLTLKIKKNKKKSLKQIKKSKNKTNKTQEKPAYLNYYLKDKINFLNSELIYTLNNLVNKENSEFYENIKIIAANNINYREEQRAFILIWLKDLIYQICQQNINVKFPDNFIFAVIALFDSYLTKCEKQVNKQDMVKILYGCADIIDKEQNLGIFTSPFFQKYHNNGIEFEILEIVDLELYPAKLYDFFEVFYFKVSQNKKNDTVFINYFKIFRQTFLDLAFYLLFHEYSKTKKPSINFISCLLLTYEKTKNFLPKKDNYLDICINEFKNKFEYLDDEYSNIKIIIEESFYIYNKMYDNLKSK